MRTKNDFWKAFLLCSGTIGALAFGAKLYESRISNNIDKDKVYITHNLRKFYEKKKENSLYLSENKELK
ncbi:hypothetical protein KY312_04815 [Candidatus Woesearchaeota archaeon]|nr:hypothetical protein [Candidatus Woesearchaeota archaeon]